MTPAGEIGGSIALFFSATLASSAGIGGGGLCLPVLIVIFGFSFSKAVVLSLCAVFGNILAQFSLNYNSRHPYDLARPLIYWDAILVLLPAQLGGSSIGVIIASVAPKTVLMVLAMITLCFAGLKTLQKGLVRWKRETSELVALRQPLMQEELNEKVTDIEDSLSTGSECAISGTRFLISHKVNEDTTNCLPTISVNKDEFDILAEQAMSMQVSREILLHALVIPWDIINTLLVLWSYSATMIILMHTYSQCSWKYYTVLGAMYPVLIAVSCGGLIYVRRKQESHPISRLESDINWSEASFLPPCITFIVGCLCSLLGIGGGELMGPLLLSMGVLPQVCSATTSVLSMFVSASSVLMYTVKGDMQWTYAAWMMGIGLVGGFTGRKMTIILTYYFNRPSLTIFALVGVLVCALCLLVYSIIMDETDFVFHSLCS